MLKVTFNYADRPLRLSNKIKIRSFIQQVLFATEAVPLNNLTYIFCSDEFLLNINRSFLKHDDYTDIITFDLSESESITGEVYISTDRVLENAKLYNTKPSDEFLRVIFHGALHLCGYKDKKEKDTQTMREKEDFYINLYKKRST